MAVAVFNQWAGVTSDRYDAVRRIVDREGNPAHGGLFHIAATDESGLYVTDLWESAEEFQPFVANRLMPDFQQIGITTEPKVTVLPAHAVFTPAYKPV